MAGKILGAVFNLLNAIFLTEWSRWVWLATVMPIQNISGGYLTFIMMTYSFIADNSTNRLLLHGWDIVKVSADLTLQICNFFLNHKKSPNSFS